MNALSIVLETMRELHTAVTNILYGAEKKWASLDDLIDLLMEVCLTFVRQLITRYLADVNQRFMTNKGRRRSSLKVKERGLVKTVLTRIGQVEIPKDIYVDTETGHFVAPVLDLVALRPHQKVTDGVMDACTMAALDVSYAKSSQFVTGGELSRQTISSYVKKHGSVSMLNIPAKKRKVEVLNVYMDEDHIALQHTYRKKHTIVPFGVVAEGLCREGKDPDHPGRTRLLNPAYFVDRNLSTKAVVQGIAGYIAAVYDPDTLKCIYVHGDAGAWIRKALEDELGAQHVLDGFHLTREINRFGKLFPGEEKTVIKTLNAALKKDDKAAFNAEIDAREASAATEAVRTRCQKLRTYFRNNWDAAVLRQNPQILGSCTEGQVQHLCSCRISSLPMSWSLEGVGSLMMLRAARANKVDIARPRQEERQIGGYSRWLEEARQEGIGGHHDWSLFEHQQYDFNQDSGTQHLIKLIKAGGHRTSA